MMIDDVPNMRGVMVLISGVCHGDSPFVIYDDASYLWIRDALAAAPYYSPQGQAFWAKYDHGAADILRGVLVEAGFIEYGTSPRGAWLTGRGKAVLSALDSVPGDFDWFSASQEASGCYGKDCENCAAVAPLLEF